MNGVSSNTDTRKIETYTGMTCNSIYVGKYAWMCIHTCVFAHMHTHATPHMYAHYACMCIKCMYTHMYVCADVHMCICIYACNA